MKMILPKIEVGLMKVCPCTVDWFLNRGGYWLGVIGSLENHLSLSHVKGDSGRAKLLIARNRNLIKDT